MWAQQNFWYLDLYAFQPFTNNKDLFVKELCLKYFDFTTTGGQILWAEGIEIIAIPLLDKSLLKLWDVAYGLNCNSNLISLGQLRNNNITYVNNFEVIILVQIGHSITYAKCDQNFFVLELTISNKIIQINRRGQPIHLVSKSRKIRV